MITDDMAALLGFLAERADARGAISLDPAEASTVLCTVHDLRGQVREVLRQGLPVPAAQCPEPPEECSNVVTLSAWRAAKERCPAGSSQEMPPVA